MGKIKVHVKKAAYGFLDIDVDRETVSKIKAAKTGSAARRMINDIVWKNTAGSVSDNWKDNIVWIDDEEGLEIVASVLQE